MQEELLGKGRYGEVYKVNYSNKMYAGKIIYGKLLPGYPHPSADQISQLIEDIENVSVMIITSQHVNIEQFFSIIQLTSDGPLMLLTELLPDNLNSYITRMIGTLPIHKQLELCHNMAKGLQFLHNAGYIHHNLHGGNVLISKDGQAKIADYICPLINSFNERTVHSDKVYVPPESIREPLRVSKKSDIYSLGVLCLQVSTQSPPMPSDNLELPEIQRWKNQLDQITKHPLFSLIFKCLNFAVARPDIDHVCTKILIAKEAPMSAISRPYHIQVNISIINYIHT